VVNGGGFIRGVLGVMVCEAIGWLVGWAVGCRVACVDVFGSGAGGGDAAVVLVGGVVGVEGWGVGWCGWLGGGGGGGGGGVVGGGGGAVV